MGNLAKAAAIAGIVGAIVAVVGLVAELGRAPEHSSPSRDVNPPGRQVEPTNAGRDSEVIAQSADRHKVEEATVWETEVDSARSGLSTPDRAPGVAALPSLQTESYRLSARRIKVEASSVDLDLEIESNLDDLFRFSIYEPYIVDENGVRLDLNKDWDGLVERGVEVLPRSTRRGRLSFCAMTKGQVRVGGFAGSAPTCTGEGVADGGFTFSADEIRPVPRRKIVLTLRK